MPGILYFEVFHANLSPQGLKSVRIEAAHPNLSPFHYSLYKENLQIL